MSAVENTRISKRARPMRAKRFKAVGNADTRFHRLAGNRFGSVTKAVLQPEIEPIQADLFGQLVIEGLLHDRRLRHAEATKGTGDRAMGVDGAALSAIIRR